jgi:multiple sugar transport system substrate-binding protein
MSDERGHIVRTDTIVLAAILLLTPLGAKAADLVVWWDEGRYAEEDEAVREIITAFEQDTGMQVELVFQPELEHPDALAVALQAGQPPDFAFGYLLTNYQGQWSVEDRLVDLSDAVGHFADLFDPDTLAYLTWRNARAGKKALYGLPMGRTTTHLHVWKSLLERAGYTLADIPKEWAAFWSFWCEVQPAVRRATGRDDIWGAGLPMSVSLDTTNGFFPFLAAYEAHYVTRDGRLVIDEPEVRQRLVRAIDSYTAMYRKGCTPPGSVAWDNSDNNKAFHAQAVVMTVNQTLSIPNALKSERPDDYYENTATIQWPLGPSGKLFPILGGGIMPGVVFKDGDHVATAKEFVRFLVGEGWLAHYLNFSGERMLPPMQKLIDQPFWLDPSDPHRMAAVMQVSSRPPTYEYGAALGDPRHDRVWQEWTWADAIHRVAAEGISPEQAVDEAIARIKEILSE